MNIYDFETPLNNLNYDDREKENEYINKEDPEIKEISEEIEKDINKEIKESHSFISEELINPIIIFCIFVFLSVPNVQEFIGKYIKNINPNNNGELPFLCVLVYGLLLSFLFTVIKKFLK
jgi:hypothetical protein